MDRPHDKTGASTDAADETHGIDTPDHGDDWVQEVIAITRPGVEIIFPARNIDDREIPFVYDDFR